MAPRKPYSSKGGVVLNDGLRYILSFLANLRRAKGSLGQVELHVAHWFPQGANLSSRVSPPLRRLAGYLTQSAREQKENEDSRSFYCGLERPLRGVITDGYLRLGEQIEFEGVTPYDGFIYLFNLDPDGFCQRLWPTPLHPKNFVRGGQPFRFPSVQFLRDPWGTPMVFDVRPSASTGESDQERFLAIVTKQEQNIDVGDLHSELWLRQDKKPSPPEDPDPQAAGSPHPQITIGKPHLFRLSKSAWDYGLLELDVREK